MSKLDDCMESINRLDESLSALDSRMDVIKSRRRADAGRQSPTEGWIGTGVIKVLPHPNRNEKDGAEIRFPDGSSETCLKANVDREIEIWKKSNKKAKVTVSR